MSRSVRRVAFVLSAVLPASLLLLAQPSAYATTVSVATKAHTAQASSVRSAVLRLPVAANDVAAYWRGSPAAHVRLAFSRDGVRFGAPVDAGRDEVGEQRGNGITYGAIHAADGAVAVRVTSDRVLSQVFLLGMNDGARTVRRTQQPASASAAVPQPPVQSRAAWGADESYRFKDGVETWKRTFWPSKKLIVHHTNTPNGESDPATVQSRLRSMYYYHAITQGWGDIGYNFLIDETGKVYEGRYSRDYAGGTPSGDDANGNGVTGAHSSGWNSGTVGIAVLGTLTSQDATPAARSTLTDMLAWEAERNGLDPKATTTFTNPVSGATITTQNIGGHRDYGSTECPGGSFYATLPTVRNDVAAKIAASSTTTTTSPSPTPDPTPTATATPADTTPPSAPSGLTGTTASRSVTLSWTAPTGEPTGYEVHRDSGSGYSLLGTTSATSYKNGGLKAGRIYNYKVLAYDAAGNRSGFSNEVRITAK